MEYSNNKKQNQDQFIEESINILLRNEYIGVENIINRIQTLNNVNVEELIELAQSIQAIECLEKNN